jgi:hypothetical protein
MVTNSLKVLFKMLIAVPPKPDIFYPTPKEKDSATVRFQVTKSRIQRFLTMGRKRLKT